MYASPDWTGCSPHTPRSAELRCPWPGAWTDAVPEDSSPPSNLWHRVAPQVPGSLRWQSSGLAESSCTAAGRRRATLHAGVRRR